MDCSPAPSLHRAELVCRSGSEEDCRHIVRHVYSRMRLHLSCKTLMRMVLDFN